MHYYFKMSHYYNIKANKNAEHDALAKLEQNIITSINELKDKVLNLKDIVYKNTILDSLLNAIVWEKGCFMRNKAQSYRTAR